MAALLFFMTDRPQLMQAVRKSRRDAGQQGLPNARVFVQNGPADRLGNVGQAGTY
jgi:hypothetical protein